MKLKRHILIILLLFIMLFVCIGSVSALENQTDNFEGNSVFSIDESVGNPTDEFEKNEIIGVDESPEILITNNGTFTDLATRIDDAIANNDSVLYLPYDFAYNHDIDFDKFFYDGILIDKTVTIYGNNHIISGEGSKIFQVNTTGGVVTLNNISFIDSVGAIYTNNTDFMINDCNFINNTFYGAIHGQRGVISITNSIFAYNTGIPNGGAIQISGGALSITNSTFTNNTADEWGGAVKVLGGSLSVDNCLFADNTAFNDDSGSTGGAIDANGVDTIITNSKFKNNSAKNGGALYLFTSYVEIYNSSFTDNTATYDENRSQGGAIYNAGYLNIADCNFDGNKAIRGYSIYNSCSDLILSNNNISSTKAEIYNDRSTIASTTNLTVLANKTVKTKYGQTVTLNATYTDDNGNLIYDPYFNFTVYGVANPIPATYADSLYTATYKADKVEEKVISVKLLYDVTTYNGLLDIGPSNDTTIVFAPDLIKYYKGSEKFTVTVTDGKGQVTPKKTVDITINGVTYSRSTDENGTAKLNINLNSGEYPVSVAVDDVVVNSTIIVKATIHALDLVKMFNEDKQYYATFVDVNGIPLVNTTVSLNVNGVIYNPTTNKEGSVFFDISNLQPGDYIITATNPVTGEMKSNNIKVISLIESDDLIKYYRNASQFAVRILAPNGKYYVLAGEEVQFNINGVLYTRTTNATGHAELNINLGQGNYTITTSYKNCSQVNNIKVLPVLTAEDIEMKYNDGTQFIANLVDGQGKPYAGQTVQFNINGVFYNVVSDASGQAKLNINLMAGEYIITSSYNGCNIANKITIRG